MPAAKTIPAPNNRTVNIQSPDVANTHIVDITSAAGSTTAVDPLVLAGYSPAMLPIGSRWILRVLPDSFSDQILFWVNMGAVAAVGAGEPFWSYEGVFPIVPVVGKQGLSIIKDTRTDLDCHVYLIRKDQ
jgi:hypothetical protein